MKQQFKLFSAALIATALVTGTVVVQAQNDVVKDWNGSLALGASLAKGNSDTLMLSASADAAKLWKYDEIRLGVDGQYGLNDWGENTEVQTANNIHGFADYKHLFSEKFYGNVRADALHDEIADVKYRFIIGPAAGFYFIKSPETRLSGELGPSFITQKLGSVEKSYCTLRVTERFEHQFGKGAKIWEQVDYYPQVDDFDNYLIVAEVGAEAALNARLSLRIVLADKYDSKPAAGRDSNDLTLVASVVWKYGG